MVKFFGTTINETISAFRPVHLGNNQSNSYNDDKLRAIARIVVTFLLFGLSVYLITSGVKGELGNIIIGTIMGYWLK